MEELFRWAKAAAGRSFVVRLAGSHDETKWRVAVWVKQEGSGHGPAGHGSSNDLDEAIARAIDAWRHKEAGEWLDTHEPGQSWYAPRTWSEK